MEDRPQESSAPTSQTAVKDVKVGGDFVVGNITQIGTLTQHFLPNQDQQELEARQKLLKGVKNDVDALLRQSLYNSKQIDLSKELRPSQVQSRRDQGISRARPESMAVPPEQKMISIFNDASQKLLIIGGPGSGKTIALLDLASELIARSEAKPNEPNILREPIPILLNLATWKVNQPINSWIIEELKSRYGVRRDLGRGWLKQRQLLPLLDELDRLRTEDQEACIVAINELLHQEDQPEGLVVCSRLEEYTSHNVKLELEEAICIKSLTESQIRDYLSRSIGYSELWKNVQEDSSLLKSVKSPLFLSILVWTLAPQKIPIEQLDLVTEKWRQCQSAQERRQYFFKIFIDQMMTRSIQKRHYPKGKEPPSDITQRWLIMLAKVVREKSPTDFIIENIQPSWWFTTKEEKTYNLIVRLVVGLIAGIIAGLYLYGWSYLDRWSDRLIILFLAILSGGVTGAFSHVRLPVLDSFSGFSKKLLYSILPGLIFFVLTSMMISVVVKDSDISWSWLAILTGIGVGIVFYSLSAQRSIKASDNVEFSIKRAIRYTGFGLVLGIVFIPLHILLNPERYLCNFRSFYDCNFTYAFYELFIFFLIGLLVGCIPGKQAKIDLKKLPNQGIWRSRNRSILWFLVGGLFSGIATTVMDKFEITRTTGIALTVGLLASLICSSNSGLVCIQHFVLRFILFRKKYAPWNYTRFLEYATERKLLQRVGGRYRFWHDSLREHFSEIN